MTLYLTDFEQAIYKKLPAQLQTATIETETGSSWENEQDLVGRIVYVQEHMDTKTKLAFQQLFVKLQKEGIDAVAENDFPVDALPHVFYVLGAIGLTAIIDKALQNAESIEDMEAVQACAAARHNILLSNEKLLPRAA